VSGTDQPAVGGTEHPAPGLAADLVVERGAFRLDLAFEVPAGQTVAVLGPNGAGKTTLLRALAGLHPLAGGRVRLGDRVLEDVRAHVRVRPPDRHVGVVFQDHRLFPHLSARDNVAFGPRSVGVPRARARADGQRWLDRLGLVGLGDRRPAALSAGQAQRVGLARALAAGPGLLLLDEPLSALDPATREDVRGELRRQLAGFAGPALVVTHDVADALGLADRLVVVEDGRIVQDASSQEVSRRPLTPFVARVVGVDLLSGSVRDGRLLIDADHGGGQLLLGGRYDQLTGPVLAAVRPAAVRLQRASDAAATAGAGDTPGNRRTSWPGRVASVRSQGGRVLVELDGAPALLADLEVRTAVALDLSPGSDLVVSVAADDVEVYRRPVAPAPRA